MNKENELERLQRRVEKEKKLVHESEIKIEELDAALQQLYHFENRVTIFHKDDTAFLKAA